MRSAAPRHKQRPAWSDEEDNAPQKRRWGLVWGALVIVILIGLETARHRTPDTKPTIANPTNSSLLSSLTSQKPPAERDLYGGDLPPQNGKDLAERMVQAMAINSSMLISSSRDLTIKGAETLTSHLETTVSFQREPPLYSCVTVDTVTGTRKIIADGANLYDYQVSPDTFVRRRFSGSFPDLMVLVSQIKPEVFSITSLLAGGNLSANFSGYRILREERLGDEPCYVLEATVSQDRLQSLQKELLGNGGYGVLRGTYKIWVAVRDKLPRQWKSEVGFGEPKESGMPTKSITIQQFERVNRFVVEPVFRVTPYHFDTPKTTREVFRPVS